MFDPIIAGFFILVDFLISGDSWLLSCFSLLFNFNNFLDFCFKNFSLELNLFNSFYDNSTLLEINSFVKHDFLS